jgi:glycosyltransferase involved in cell wall biosynthesis
MFYCPFLGRGGAEKHFTRLAASFNSTDYEKIMVVSKSGGEYEEILNGKNVRLISLDIKSSSSLLTLIWSIFPLVKLINREKPDVFLSVMDMVNAIVSIVKKLSRPRFKVVYLVQASLKNAIAFQKSNLKSFLNRIMPGIYANADGVIVLSEGVRQEIIGRLPPEKTRHIHTIHNIGITEENIIVSQSGLRNKHSIVCCGRLVKLKGFDVLIRSMVEVRQKFPSVHLSIVGDGPERQNLEKLVQDLSLQNNVKFVGFVKAPEQYFLSSEIFALTSFLEGFGNVIVEAMVSGAAVIATDCPHGPKEIIQHGINGLLVPVNNIEALSKAIIQMLENPELLRKLATAGMNRSKDFLPEVIAKQFEAKIEEVLVDNANTAREYANH